MQHKIPFINQYSLLKTEGIVIQPINEFRLCNLFCNFPFKNENSYFTNLCNNSLIPQQYKIIHKIECFIKYEVYKKIHSDWFNETYEGIYKNKKVIVKLAKEKINLTFYEKLIIKFFPSIKNELILQNDLRNEALNFSLLHKEFGKTIKIPKIYYCNKHILIREYVTNSNFYDLSNFLGKLLNSRLIKLNLITKGIIKLNGYALINANMCKVVNETYLIDKRNLLCSLFFKKDHNNIKESVYQKEKNQFFPFIYKQKKNYNTFGIKDISFLFKNLNFNFIYYLNNLLFVSKFYTKENSERINKKFVIEMLDFNLIKEIVVQKIKDLFYIF